MSFDFYLEYKANKARILDEMKAEQRQRRDARGKARKVLRDRFWRVALPVLLVLPVCAIVAVLAAVILG